MHVVQPLKPPPISPQAPKVRAPKVRVPRGLGLLGARGGTIGLALAAGLAAALLAFLMVRGRLPVAPAAPARVPVVIAARDIPARTKLSAAWLRVRLAAPADLPDGAGATLAAFAGKVTTVQVPVGVALTRQAVTEPSAALGMAFALPPSQRALTVALDPADAADQFVRPGDHVDILAADEPGSGPAEARTVLQNVRLLAVGTQTDPNATAPAPSSGPAHITVAVSPAQAQTLVLVAARGKIHLALRAPDDTAVAVLPVFPAMPSAPAPAKPAPHTRTRRPPTAALEEILPLPPLPARIAPAPPARVLVTIIKGSQSQTVSVDP